MNIKEGERGLKKSVPTNLRLDHYTSQTLCFLILASLLPLGIYNDLGLRVCFELFRTKTWGKCYSFSAEFREKYIFSHLQTYSLFVLK